MNPLKINLIHLLQLLASAEMQEKYQAEVQMNIPDERISMWFDDFYGNHSREQLLKKTEEFHHSYETHVDELPKTYEGLRGSATWCALMQQAAETLKVLGWDKVEPSWGFMAV